MSFDHHFAFCDKKGKVAAPYNCSFSMTNRLVGSQLRVGYNC